MRQPLLHLLAFVSTMAASACAEGDSADDDGGRLSSEVPEITFGSDSGQLSASANELLAKSSGNPDPSTLVGVFELTGFGSEHRPEEFAVLTNEWRMRREHRRLGIAMAVECLIDVGGGVEDVTTLQAFVSSPIEVHEWGIRVLEQHKDDPAYTNFGFDVRCSVELVPVDVPYCLAVSGEAPDGYSICVTVRDGELMFLDNGSVTEAGHKLSN